MANPEDIPKIQLIKPNLTRAEDQVSWAHTKDGNYSVKLGYHLIHSSEQMMQQKIDPKILKYIWEIEVPRNIKHFWWRLLNKAPMLQIYYRKERWKLTISANYVEKTQRTSTIYSFNVESPKEIWKLSPVHHIPGDHIINNALNKNVDELINHNKDIVTH